MIWTVEICQITELSTTPNLDFVCPQAKISVKQYDRQNKQSFNDDGFLQAFSQID